MDHAEGGKVKGSAQKVLVGVLCAVAVFLAGCAGTGSGASAKAATGAAPEYVIGPGDSLKIFVWHNPEVSVTVPVRPDGRISIPLVQDLVAGDKTPTQLAHEIEKRLARYIKNPMVTVIVTGYVGTFGNQIRVVGQAAKAQALPYRQGMTLLDVMIAVGGLTQYAAGNRAVVVRRIGGKEVKIPVKLGSLLDGGDIKANIPMRPGDILIIPESWF
ncbi:MAG TPA: sugar ABC transporter substrate-binding protein [Gammaproteobacteria bacterium]|nr:sugar ABC transporter substrate-binding protein [Chromatiales bacterium]HDK02418.1 sugar ABC transporter substrate-binding protein [Gammaproteobacteria bacterium]